MFIVVLTYTKPLDVIDAHLPAHVEYLKKQYEREVFIASGRRVPRTGGIILARAASRKELTEVLRQDPFYQHGVAEYEILEFTPSMSLPELSCLIES
ncbi:MAG: YciI family protein [Geobacter sp.]|nr:YciI family protein [Geobacter sp.]